MDKNKKIGLFTDIINFDMVINFATSRTQTVNFSVANFLNVNLSKWKPWSQFSNYFISKVDVFY